MSSCLSLLFYLFNCLVCAQWVLFYVVILCTMATPPSMPTIRNVRYYPISGTLIVGFVEVDTLYIVVQRTVSSASNQNRVRTVLLTTDGCVHDQQGHYALNQFYVQRNLQCPYGPPLSLVAPNSISHISEGVG